jgi:hypothetical protein
MLVTLPTYRRVLGVFAVLVVVSYTTSRLFVAPPDAAEPVDPVVPAVAPVALVKAVEQPAPKQPTVSARLAASACQSCAAVWETGYKEEACSFWETPRHPETGYQVCVGRSCEEEWNEEQVEDGVTCTHPSDELRPVSAGREVQLSWPPPSRADRRCGKDHLYEELRLGTWEQVGNTSAQCGEPDHPCCSATGHCGATPGHCDCDGCVRYVSDATAQELLDHHHATHNLTQTAAALHDHGNHTCDEYGKLLQGVEMYVIEMPKRAGSIHKQMVEYGVDCCVTAIPAVTPKTELGENGTTPTSLATECGNRPRNTSRFGPYHVHGTALSNTLSHLTALKHACEKPDHKDVLVVLEDDARLEPLHFWPATLLEILSELPPDWQVINGACSNLGWPEEEAHFRQHEIGSHFGAVAVIYNLKAPSAVCEKVVGKTPLEVMRASDQSKLGELCQPSDIFIYCEFSGVGHGCPLPSEKPFPMTSNRPLFYFSSDTPNDEETFVKDASHPGTAPGTASHLWTGYETQIYSWARIQRIVWAVFWQSRSAEELIGGEACRDAAAEKAASYDQDAIEIHNLSSPTPATRADGHCGTEFISTVVPGKPAECADKSAPCCSDMGWCGSSSAHCLCAGCHRFNIP